MSDNALMDWYQRQDKALDAIMEDLAWLLGYHRSRGAIPLDQVKQACDRAAAIARGDNPAFDGFLAAAKRTRNAESGGAS